MPPGDGISQGPWRIWFAAGGQTVHVRCTRRFVLHGAPTSEARGVFLFPPFPCVRCLGIEIPQALCLGGALPTPGNERVVWLSTPSKKSKIMISRHQSSLISVSNGTETKAASCSCSAPRYLSRVIPSPCQPGLVFPPFGLPHPKAEQYVSGQRLILLPSFRTSSLASRRLRRRSPFCISTCSGTHRTIFCLS